MEFLQSAPLLMSLLQCARACTCRHSTTESVMTLIDYEMSLERMKKDLGREQCIECLGALP